MQPSPWEIGYLGCRFSINFDCICLQNSHTTVAASQKVGYCKRVSLQYSYLLLKLAEFPLPKDLRNKHSTPDTRVEKAVY